MQDPLLIPNAFQADAQMLSKAVIETSAGILVFQRNAVAPSPESLSAATELLAADPKLNVILQFSSDITFLPWKAFPPRLAALRENPTQSVETMILRVSNAKSLGFQDVSEPLWDFIIRASKTPESIRADVLEKPQAPINPPNSELPALAPSSPGRSRGWLLSHLESVSPEELAPRLTSRADAVALKAGLLQLHDDLDASHELSQSIEGEGRHRAGDYWHAIMHRREPDYSNAKYWFRRVGNHPIFESLAKSVDSILSRSETAARQSARQKLLGGARWDPLAFVDFCQECCRSEDPQTTEIAQQIQRQEMFLLLDQTYRDATE